MTKTEAIRILSNFDSNTFKSIDGVVRMSDVLELLNQVPEWIDCDECLPEQGELVITLIYGHDVIVQNEGETFEQALERISHYARTSVGFYGSDGWYGAEGYPEICTPKYWIPIPKPPEEKP